jgi:lipopolysaccharide/colanic/teichoic acid biosynthesis glycosyltransferase
MRNVAEREFGLYEADREGRELLVEQETLERMLDSRRLVLLSGPRLSGRSRRAYDALQHRFKAFKLLRPAMSGAGREPPLTALLTTRVLSLRGRYILWLDDLALLMQAGFDPRVIERWLAAGRGRVAVARITPMELRRIRTSRTAAVALGRAVEVRVPAPLRTAPRGSAEERYRRLVEDGAPEAAAVRLLAATELLGLPSWDRVSAQRILNRVTGVELTDEMLTELTKGPNALLRRDGVELSAHPGVLDTVDEEMGSRVGSRLLDALIERLGAPALIALSQALGVRGLFEEAEQALARAREKGEKSLQAAIASTSVQLLELSQGPSGVTLINTGGWDFTEPMGWRQRKFSSGRRWAAQDEAFDSTLPPEVEKLSSRLYRLTVYRGVARGALLVVIDTLAVVLACMAALSVRAWTQHHAVDLLTPDLVKLVLPAVGAAIPIAVWLGLYRPDRPRAQMNLILLTMSVMSILVAAVFFVARADVGSLFALFTLFAAAWIIDGFGRYCYDTTSRKWVKDRRLQPRALILGNAKEARACAQNITSGGRPVQPVAFLSKGKEVDPYWVGRYEDLEHRAVALHAAEIVIADRKLNMAEKADLIERAQRLGMDVRFVANEDEIVLGAVGQISDHGLIHVPAALITPEALELKRITDLVIVTGTLPLWGMIIASYAAYSALRRPGQPIFVPAERVGLGSIGYLMVRLRTRRVHPDDSRGAVASGRVEAFFERYGLDELPQVINVLRGEMSIVGPRPLAAADVRRLKRAQLRGLGTRPGMTGRWQVEWGEETGTPEMRALDAEYLRRWRITRDLDLIIRTPWVIARRRRYLGDTEIRLRLRQTALVS